MQIKSYLNTTQREVDVKGMNILLGVSLGNRYFNKTNIENFLLWSLDHTKSKVAILIADDIQTINYHIRNGYSKERAKKVASRKGEEMETVIREVTSCLNPTERKRVVILRWHDIETSEYSEKLKVIKKAFQQNVEFKKRVLGIVQDYNTKTSSGDILEQLAEYLLRELPILIEGVHHEKHVYELLLYPGLSGIDNLAVELQEGKVFPKISSSLHITSKLKILEAYAG
jgi:tRNA-dependent cyclodipeptide synthase